MMNHYYSIPQWSDWRRDPPLLTVALALPESRQSAGGKARAAKLSPERRKEIARLAAQARWRTVDHVADAGKMIDRDWMFVASKGRMK